MARGKKQIEGQMTFDFCLDIGNYIVQHNNLVDGKQSLKLNSAKLIRGAIMQIKKEDTEIKPYIITIKELAEMLNVSPSNLYRDIDEITDDIIKNPVFVREEVNGKTVRFAKIPWVSRCEYKADVGVYIKLNEELKPYLLGLQENYTQYSLMEIYSMKSIYSIRIYELIESKIMHKSVPKFGTDVTISIQELRECCGCEEKYPVFNRFKERVIDTAVNEINSVTFYDLSYTYEKKGKSVLAINFTITRKFNNKRLNAPN